MAKLIIEGPSKLQGEIFIHGAKNSTLPLLAAAMLCSTECVLHNCPVLSDVDTAAKILQYLGCKISRSGSDLLINSSSLCNSDIPDFLMREMRSSIVFLGAIVTRTGQAKLSFPGGCEIGPRPIDLHLWALRKMGVVIEENHGCLDCKTAGRLNGANIGFSFPSVGATENVMIAASCAKGTTVITNAAREPEICDLADFLNECGAKITGAGQSTIVIEGVDSLTGCEHNVIPDRIAATTFMTVAAITGSKLLISNINPYHLEPIIPVFEEAGCRLKITGSQIQVSAPGRLNRIKSIRTMPYPGFPTDAQAPVMAMTTLANGTSVFVENIFESRYKHVGELLRLGANIKVEGRVAVVEGVQRLSGAPVEAPDLRGGAALVAAGLAAEGITQITGLKHIDRGYESIENSLFSIGAIVKRV
ncbi:MAG TPA: UDP-N-acetylglucosamine 1-carboxyvinyltransferase [Oscillospiraceae bacterium]|nr:UDP-N-acetylglucosamine 1-carboxyvinyltransferase [Oscillospiraceae bacterium]